MILFVCEGNVCRSVLAAGLLRSVLPGELDLAVKSAGTAALVGEGADPTTMRIAARQGVSLDGHRATQLTPELMAKADMVVAATRQLRGAAVQMHPPAVKYAFTLRQLARLLQTSPVGFERNGYRGSELVTHLVTAVNPLRGQYTTTPSDDDDIPDPRGRSNRVHERAAEACSHAVAAIARSLGVSSIPWTPARFWGRQARRALAPR